MASIYLYKIWYIVAALVLLATLGLMLSRKLRIVGLLKGLGFILLYFGFLLLTSTWAVRPELTRSWVAIDSIQIVVFLLFYLLGLNNPPDRLLRFFRDVMLAALLVAVVLWWMHPKATRQGGRAPHLLACLLPFCAVRFGNKINWKDLACFLVGLGVIIVSMSRTPLLGATVGMALLPFFITTTWLQFARTILLLAAVGIAVIGCLLLFDTTRGLAARTFARLSGQTVTVNQEIIIPGPLDDEARGAIEHSATRLFWENLPWGIGYMNYPAFFQFHYGKAFEKAGGIAGFSLHNSYQTWGLETGLPGIAIVGLLLYRYFSILKRKIDHAREPDEKLLGKACLIAMISLLVMGLFFQIHQSPAFFLLLGLVYSFEGEKRSRRKIVWE